MIFIKKALIEFLKDKKVILLLPKYQLVQKALFKELQKEICDLQSLGEIAFVRIRAKNLFSRECVLVNFLLPSFLQRKADPEGKLPFHLKIKQVFNNFKIHHCFQFQIHYFFSISLISELILSLDHSLAWFNFRLGFWGWGFGYVIFWLFQWLFFSLKGMQKTAGTRLVEAMSLKMVKTRP